MGFAALNLSCELRASPLLDRRRKSARGDVSMRSQAIRFSRDAIAFVRRSTLLTFAIVALTAPALGDDQKSGKAVTQGELMCALSIYVRIQIHTAICGIARRPIDDAIDEAIAEIEEFSLANFPDRITRSVLEDARRIAKESPLFDPARNKNLCKEGGFFEDIHGRDPDQFRKEVKEMLSRPPGPSGIFQCRMG
jgi:hypothetical protein